MFIWGVATGIIVIIERLIRNRDWYEKIPVYAKIAFTILIICMGWILFQASDLIAAEDSYRNLFVSSAKYDPPNFTWRFFMTRKITIFMIISVIGAFGGFIKLGRLIESKTNSIAFSVITKCLCLLLLLLVIMFVMGTSFVPFVFQSF